MEWQRRIKTTNGRETHVMAEANPGIANMWETWNGRRDSRHYKQWRNTVWQRRLQVPQTAGKHDMTEATPGTANDGEAWDGRGDSRYF